MVETTLCTGEYRIYGGKTKPSCHYGWQAQHPVPSILMSLPSFPRIPGYTASLGPATRSGLLSRSPLRNICISSTPSQETLRRGKRFAPSIGRFTHFTQLMTLLHNVVKTFDLADHGRYAVLLVIASYSRGSGLAAVKRVSMLKTLGYGRDDFMHIPNKNI